MEITSLYQVMHFKVFRDNKINWCVEYFYYLYIPWYGTREMEFYFLKIVFKEEEFLNLKLLQTFMSIIRYSLIETWVVGLKTISW